MHENKRFEEKFKQTWSNVCYRCTNPRDSHYEYYSKRGICDEWLNFINFRDDMLDSYTEHIAVHGFKETTIDRIDNTKGYSKENCKWATWKEQQENSNHAPLPVLTKICPECNISFETKSVSKKFCQDKCARVNVEKNKMSIDEIRARNNKYRNERYALNKDFRDRIAANNKKWITNKLKNEPEYILVIREQQNRSSKKYHKANPKKIVLTNEQKEKQRQRYNYKYHNDPIFKKKEQERNKIKDEKRKLNKLKQPLP